MFDPQNLQADRQGVKKDEVVFADNLSPQPNKVYTKLAQVKNLWRKH